MAGDVTQKLKLIIEEHGAKAATSALDKMNVQYGRMNAQQDKHEKGSAAMGKNSTANFAKMSQGLGGLVHIYATVAANVFALSSAFSVLSNAADVSIMVDAAEHLSKSTGVSYANVAKNMKTVTQGALSMEEALRSASIGISSGLSGKQMQQITEIATKAANALGRSVPEAINRMTQAVVKNEPELVDEYGIILRVDEAMREYAETLGKAKSELTSFDKQMSIHAQLVNQGEQKFGGVDAQVNSYNKLSAAFAEMTTHVLQFINQGLEPLADVFAENSSLLAAVAAVFAKGIFDKAIPEVRNYTNSLKENQKLLQDQLENKIADIDLQSAPDFSFDIASKDKDVLIKDLESLSKDKAFGGIGESIAEQIQSGFSGEIDSSFKKEFKDLSDAAEEALETGSKKVTINNVEVERDKVRRLTETYKTLTDVKYKEANASKRETGFIDRNIAKLKLKTTELQKQRILRKQAVNLALQEGLAGNSPDISKSFMSENLPDASIFTKGYVKVAGVFGRIASVVGNIGSLISGWGVALFVITQAVAPLADALGFASKKAREGQDNLQKSNEQFKKLAETADSLANSDIKDMQGYIDNLTASANNFNEQLDNIVSSFSALASMKDLTALDKLFNWDSTAAKKGINSVVRNIEDLYESRGIDVPDNLKGLVQNAVNLTQEIEKQKEHRDKIRDSLENENLSQKAINALNTRLATTKSKIAGFNKDLIKTQDKITKGAADQLQNQRDLTEMTKEASDAASSLAKSQAESRSKFSKSSPYFKTIQDLESMQQLIDKAEGNQAKLNIQAEEYATKLGKGTMSAENFTKEIKNQIAYYKDLNTQVLAGKTEQLALETELLNIDNEIANGNASAILRKVDINKELLQVKLDAFRVELISLEIQKNSTDEAAEKASIELNILNIATEMNKLITSTLNKNEGITREYNAQTTALDKRLGILNAESDKLNTQIGMAKLYESTQKESMLQRAKAAKEIEIIETNIEKLRKKQNTDKPQSAVYAKEIEAHLAKKLALEKQINNEYSIRETAERSIAKNLKRSVEQMEVEASSIDILINKKQNLQSRDATTSKNRLKLASEELALTEMRFKAEEKILDIQIKNTKRLLKVLKDKKKNDGSLSRKDEESFQNLTLSNAVLLNEQLSLRNDMEQEIYDKKLQQFELQKQATDAATVFEDPKGFANLLGQEFQIISKAFSDSMMDPVTRTADSILRITDTIVDTLYEAIAAGENVGQAIWEAVVQVTSDIAKEITSDIMKQWTRDLLASMFGIKSEAQVALEEQKTQTEILKEIRDKQCNKPQSQDSMLEEQIGGWFDDDDEVSKEGFLKVADAVKAGNFSAKQTAMELMKSFGDDIADLGGNLTQMLSKMITAQTPSGSGGSWIDSLVGIGSTLLGGNMIPGTSGGAGLTGFGSISGSAAGTASMMASLPAYENGGIVNSLNRYANGTITDGPELAMIGDNSNGKEAVVPLPSGDSIPVEFMENSGGDTTINNNITITGTNTNNSSDVRRSAGQVAAAAGLATRRAVRRNT